jgi:hypothetical protein
VQAWSGNNLAGEGQAKNRRYVASGFLWIGGNFLVSLWRLFMVESMVSVSAKSDGDGSSWVRAADRAFGLRTAKLTFGYGIDSDMTCCYQLALEQARFSPFSRVRRVPVTD